MRYVKPEFWTDGVVVQLSSWARLFYIGSWNFALCDRGHLPDDAAGLKLKVLPADPVDGVALLDELISTGRIARKQLPDGRSYLHIIRLADHQKVDSRWAPKCPFCAHEASSTAPSTASAAPAEPLQPSLDLSEPRESLTEPRESSEDFSPGGDRRGEEGIGERPSDVVAARPRDQRATRIPDDFAPTPEMIAWARRETPQVGTVETARFVDYWRAKPGAAGRKLDWPATWRNWMRRAQDDLAHRGLARASPGTALAHTAPRSTTDERVQHALNLGAQLATESVP
jgi:hypothetical protein